MQFYNQVTIDLLPCFRFKTAKRQLVNVGRGIWMRWILEQGMKQRRVWDHPALLGRSCWFEVIALTFGHGRTTCWIGGITCTVWSVNANKPATLEIMLRPLPKVKEPPAAPLRLNSTELSPYPALSYHQAFFCVRDFWLMVNCVRLAMNPKYTMLVVSLSDISGATRTVSRRFPSCTTYSIHHPRDLFRLLLF